MSFMPLSFVSSGRVALATLAIGGATLAATAAVTSTPADAHRRLVFRTGIVYRAPLYSVAPAATVVVISNSCAAYRWRAQAYNSVYWWDRYKDCKGD
jgi:hypothetical protein